LGVSNFPPGHLQEAFGLADIFCNQVEFHVYLGQPKLERLAREHPFLLTAYCPLARGRIKDDPTLAEIGQGHGKSPSQVALRWLVQKENVSAVPKSSSEAHLRSNLEVFDFTLSADEVRRIDALDRGERLIDPGFAPEWDR
jgi:2,5-diketo-D-gluconate reductase B